MGEKVVEFQPRVADRLPKETIGAVTAEVSTESSIKYVRRINRDLLEIRVVGVRVRSIRATHLGFDEHLNPTNLRFVAFERQTGPIDDFSTNVGHLYGCESMEDALNKQISIQRV